MSPPLKLPFEAPVADGLASSALSEIVLPLSLAIIMIGLGLSLTRADFQRIRQEPRAVAAGVVAQILALPVVGVATVLLLREPLGLTPALVAGLLLTTCLPGGATSNLVAYLARADAALSVTLTSITSLASAVTTPIAFGLAMRFANAGDAAIDVGLADVGLLVLVIVVIPILIGMEIRRRRPGLAARLEPKLRTASAVFLGLVVLALVIENRTQLLELGARMLPAALVLNLLALGAGLAIAHIANLRASQGRTIAIEIAFQNGTLGIAIALTQLGDSEAALFPAFYSLVMFATGGLAARVWSRMKPADETAPTAA